MSTQWLDQLLCWIRRRHAWDYLVHKGDYCVRCGLTRVEYKRKTGKEPPTDRKSP
jgi:hypothetical protein